MNSKTTLKAGTVLYHGTDSDAFQERVDALDGPSWLSSARSVASHFALNRSGSGGLKRVISYRLARDVELCKIMSARGLQALAQEHGFSAGSSESIRDGIAASGLPGWVIPDNYPDGDDILICDPGPLLEHMQTEYLVDEVIVNRLAQAFLRALHEEIGLDNLREASARNQAQKARNICHSHDFCDANMVMADAWQQLTHCEVDVACQSQRDIWNQAWDAAKVELPGFVQQLQSAHSQRQAPAG